jgi:hypothetical protein
MIFNQIGLKFPSSDAFVLIPNDITDLSQEKTMFSLKLILCQFLTIMWLKVLQYMATRISEKNL